MRKGTKKEIAHSQPGRGFTLDGLSDASHDRLVIEYDRTFKADADACVEAAYDHYIACNAAPWWRPFRRVWHAYRYVVAQPPFASSAGRREVRAMTCTAPGSQDGGSDV